MTRTINNETLPKLNLQFFSEEGVVEEPTEPMEDMPAEPGEEGEDTQEVDYTEANQAFLDRFEIQFDKNPKKFGSIDELKEAAEKGSALPRYKEKVTDLESKLNSPHYKWVDDYMKANGYESGDEFVKAIQINDKKTEYQNMGMSEEDALKAAQDYVDKTHTSKASESDVEVEKFLAWHEGKVKNGTFQDSIDIDNIPEEVFEDYKAGTPLKEAYMDYMLKNIKFNTEQETINKIAKNKETSTGDIANKTASKQDMSIAQVNKLLDTMSESEQSKWADNNWEMLERIKYFG